MMMLRLLHRAVLLAAAAIAIAAPAGAPMAGSRKGSTPFQTPRYFDDRLLVVEAENFSVAEDGGWRARRWGDGNRFAAVLNNVFHSRRAYLQAKANTTAAHASAHVIVPQAGDYSVLVRYEGAYHFSAAFRVTITQQASGAAAAAAATSAAASDAVVFDRVYGARHGLKLWINNPLKTGPGGNLDTGGSCAPGQLLAAECSFPYGSNEDMLYEGVGTVARLAAGPATISLIIDNTTTAAIDAMVSANDGGTGAADRNIDCLLLTPNATDVLSRATTFEFGGLTLPLDGLLTQAGEVYFRFMNRGNETMSVVVPYMSYTSPGPTNHLTNAFWNVTTQQLLSGCTLRGQFEAGDDTSVPGSAPGGPNCTRLTVLAGARSAWTDVGRSMDTLNHGTLNLPPAGQYVLEVGVARDEVLHSGGGGQTLHEAQVEVIGQFEVDQNASLLLEVDASTRTSRRIDPQFAEFFRIVAALDEQTPHLPPPRKPRPGDPLETWPGHAVPIFFTSFPTGATVGQLGFNSGDFGPAPPATAHYNETLQRFLAMYPAKGWGCWSYCYNSSGKDPNAACYEGTNSRNGIPAAGPIVGIGSGNSASGMKDITESLQIFIDDPANDARNVSRYPNMIIQTGDEVSTYLLPQGNLSVTAPSFQRWATSRGLTLEDVGCLPSDWAACYASTPINTTTGSANLSLAQGVASGNPELFYYWNRFRADFGIATTKNVTDTITAVLPNALVGSNMNPWMDYDEPAGQYIRSFREGAFTLPWGEDVSLHVF
eukprot:SAG22_NODE_149_length_17456_cov_5.058363_2_plen_767_part_00